jgi:hypothetical protein
LEEKLTRILRQSGEYERFLASFYQLTDAPIKNLKLPLLEWLY